MNIQDQEPEFREEEEALPTDALAQEAANIQLEESKRSESDQGTTQILEPALLQRIIFFEQRQDLHEAITEFRETLKQNSLPLQTVLTAISNFFKLSSPTEEGRVETEIFQRFLSQFPQNIQVYSQLRLTSLFFRCIFALCDKHRAALPILQDEAYKRALIEQLRHINSQNMREFLTVFELHPLLNKELADQIFNENLQKKNFLECYDLTQVLAEQHPALSEALFTSLIERMQNNTDASKAADFIKRSHRDPANYPKIRERLEKNCVRFYLKNYSWFFVEEVFSQRPQFLAYIVEDLYFRGKKNEAFSIYTRHNLKQLQVLKKQDTIDSLEKESQLGNLVLVQPVLQGYDAFRPHEECLRGTPYELPVPKQQAQQLPFLELEKDFGIRPSQRFFLIESINDINFAKAQQEILQSAEIGLDTEFSSSLTKMDTNSGSILSLLQIATVQNVYVFDLLRIERTTTEWQHFILEAIVENKAIKFGVAIGDDIVRLQKWTFNQSDKEVVITEATEKEETLEQQYHQKSEALNVVDIGTLFKSLVANQKQSGLQSICQAVFDKDLSKIEQMSKWDKRPLRLAQLHYAALDAVVSLMAVHRLREKYGSELVQHHINELLMK